MARAHSSCVKQLYHFCEEYRLTAQDFIRASKGRFIIYFYRAHLSDSVEFAVILASRANN